jgi:hypothetical protein
VPARRLAGFAHRSFSCIDHREAALQVELLCFSHTESWRAEIKDTILAKMEICAIPLAVAGSSPAVDRLPLRRKQTAPKLSSDSHAQPEMATGFFCLYRPQPFEKSRFERINDSKRKQISFLLFSFTYFYLQITRALVEFRGFVADRSAACRNIRASA